MFSLLNVETLKSDYIVERMRKNWRALAGNVTEESARLIRLTRHPKHKQSGCEGTD